MYILLCRKLSQEEKVGRDGLSWKRHRDLEEARDEAIWSPQVFRCGWAGRHLSCGRNSREASWWGERKEERGFNKS